MKRLLLIFFLLFCTGNLLAQSLLMQNTFGYIDQPTDSHSHLMMLGGYRAYQPATGQFSKQDSFSPFTSSRTFNGFDYAVGNPMLMQDGSGHLPALLKKTWDMTSSGLLSTILMTGVNLFGIGMGINELMSLEETEETMTEDGHMNRIFHSWSRRTELKVGIASEAIAIAGTGLTYTSRFVPQLKPLQPLWETMDYLGAAAGFALVKGPWLYNRYESTLENRPVQRRVLNVLRSLWRPVGLNDSNFVRSGSYGAAFLVEKTPLILGTNAATIYAWQKADHGRNPPAWL